MQVAAGIQTSTSHRGETAFSILTHSIVDNATLRMRESPSVFSVRKLPLKGKRPNMPLRALPAIYHGDMALRQSRSAGMVLVYRKLDKILLWDRPVSIYSLQDIIAHRCTPRALSVNVVKPCSSNGDQGRAVLMGAKLRKAAYDCATVTPRRFTRHAR